MITNHFCLLPEAENHVILQPGFFSKLKIRWLTVVQVSPKNPRCSKFFRSEVAIRTEKKRQMLSGCPFVIHPFSTFRVWYEVYLCFLYFIVLLNKAVKAGFEGEKGEILFPGHRVITIALDGLCWADIMINFFTGYVVPKKRHVELKLRAIATHYILSPYFICDVLSSFNIYFFFYTNLTRRNARLVNGIITIMDLLKIIRLITLLRLTRRVAEYFQVRSQTLIFVFNCTLLFVICIHWIASLTFIVPRLSSRLLVNRIYEKKSWIYNYGIYIKSFLRKYSHALFKASTYIVGVRLIKLYIIQTDDDMAVALISFLIGKVLLACIWVLLALTILNSRSMDIKYHDMINQLEEYIKHKQLPTKLREKLLYYYRFKYRGKYLKEELVTSLLSETLRNEVNAHVCKSLITGVDIFSELTARQINDVVSKLKQQIFLPGDNVYQSGMDGNAMYFILTGTVAVYTHSGREICHLQDGGYFGELSLILVDRPRITTVTAIETCQIYKLDRAPFEQILTRNRKVYRKLVYFAERRLQETLEFEKVYRQQLFQESFVRVFGKTEQPAASPTSKKKQNKA